MKINYWHIQLYPGSRKADFDEKKIKQIVSQCKVIGFGGIDREHKTYIGFKDKMQIGDIVAVKHGGQPIALVKVIGKLEEKTVVNDKLDWFPVRRAVELLDFYKEAYHFKILQTRGTLSICDNLETDTSRVIMNWHQLVQRRNLMANINLSDQRKEEIKNLWGRFKKTFSDKDRAEIQSEIGRIQGDWEQYRAKIAEGRLELDDYTNRQRLETATMPKGYLCNFLERDTKSVYGSSRPGNANNFEVKMNYEGETYTYRPELKRGDKENHKTKEEATELYNKDIKHLLEEIIKAEDPIDKVEIIENSSYAAKQMLRKIAALENKGDFLFMYSDEAIDTLHAEFLDSEESRNLGKSFEVRAVANRILEVDKKNDVDSVILSKFLWKYATIKGIADENSPNVILYGPPGTGKTYMVKNSLDFLCQGDRSRYEFVQFHPSFTYEDFIEGIKPKGVSKDGNIEFELVDGIFKRFCKRAKANPDKAYYFVVDEINRANLSSVFGEILLCLEKDYRHDSKNGDEDNLVKTQYSTLITEMIQKDEKNKSLAYHLIEDPDTGEFNAYFGVPKNLYFIGMMNDVDKSIDAFDLALRRRFKWIRKDCDLEVIREETKFRNGKEFGNIDTYVESADKLNTYISEKLGLGKSYEFGHSFFMKMTGIANRSMISKRNVEQLFELHFRPTLKEYLRSLYPETELDKVLAEALAEFKAPFK